MNALHTIDTRRLTLRSVTIVTAFVLLSLPSRAGATSVTQYYDGWDCETNNADNFGDPEYNDENGGIYGASQIICPIVKTTSAPTVTSNDNISSIAITVDNGSETSGVSCNVMVYSSHLVNGASNAQPVYSATYAPTGSGHQTTTLTNTTNSSGFHFVAKNDWWNADHDQSIWYYAQLECQTAHEDQGLLSYSVTEQGTDTGFHIYPAMWACQSDYQGSSDWIILTYDPMSPDLTSGYIQAEAGGIEDFFVGCYLPGSGETGAAQFSITTTDNADNYWEWDYVDSWLPWGYGNASPMPGSNSSNGTIFPSLVFPSSTLVVPTYTATPEGDVKSGTDYSNFLDSSTYTWSYFWQTDWDNEFTGDMGIVSMRTVGDPW